MVEVAVAVEQKGGITIVGRRYSLRCNAMRFLRSTGVRSGGLRATS